MRTLVANIVHTPPGETIRIVAYSFSLGEVADPLIAAARRGVRVQIVVDGRHSHDFKATQALRDALGGNRHKDSFVILTRRSSRGTVSHCHQKSWSFSKTGKSDHVVMVGSMNLSTLSTTQQYTDVYSFVDRLDVWAAFSEVFRQQARDRPIADPATSLDLASDRAYFFPGFDGVTDPIKRELALVPAAETTSIRVAMHAWHGPRGRELANILIDKLRGGARVEVFEGRFVGDPSLDLLEEAGAVVRPGVFSSGEHIHQKLTLLDYVVDGQRHRTVITGSDNWGDASFRRDDVVVSVDLDRRGFEAYSAFLDMLVARGAS